MINLFITMQLITPCMVILFLKNFKRTVKFFTEQLKDYFFDIWGYVGLLFPPIASFLGIVALWMMFLSISSKIADWYNWRRRKKKTKAQIWAISEKNSSLPPIELFKNRGIKKK